MLAESGFISTQCFHLMASPINIDSEVTNLNYSKLLVQWSSLGCGAALNTDSGCAVNIFTDTEFLCVVHVDQNLCL